MSGFDLPPITGLDRSMRGLLGPQGPLGPDGPLGSQGPLGPEGPWKSPEVEQGPKVPGLTPGEARPFEGVLADSLEHVKGLHDDVRAKVRGMVMGEDVELHDVLIAGSKSEAAFNLLLEVRNKMVDAWEKLSRSSV